MYKHLKFFGDEVIPLRVFSGYWVARLILVKYWANGKFVKDIEIDISNEDEDRPRSSNTEGTQKKKDWEESDDEITKKNPRVLVDVCGKEED
ncbi:hypothetical protein G6F56_003739 [Rhizopus delemar]|nr:hypothetical protein G6F56_003739 [Rhizopus delemar]